MKMKIESKCVMISILLSITLICSNCRVAAELESSTYRVLKHLEGSRKLNQYSNRHEVKTIQSGDGDIIDCIDIYKQPAFDHPALRNHTIQMSPTNGPRMEKTSTKTDHTTSRKNKEGSVVTTTSQVWQRSGSCPKGTIPMIRRVPNKNLLTKANITVHAYGKKMPHKHHAVMQSNDGSNFMPNHSVAGVLTEGYSYSGGKANIKLWTPEVESEDEYSASHVSLQNGPENVQSGWAVNPSVYKDHQTRYYVYWTADDSKKTGCFDLTCPGFVQVSHEIALGGAIYPISSPTGLPFEIIVYVYKDPVTGNWWVQFGESINIGYWPAELFKLLKYHAVFVWWGGEVYSSKVRTHPHTATDMGSGRWPDWIFQTSGTITKMRVEQNFHDLKIPDWVNAHSDEYECYDVFYVSDYIDDPQLFYGGPGRNDRCP